MGFPAALLKSDGDGFELRQEVRSGEVKRMASPTPSADFGGI